MKKSSSSKKGSTPSHSKQQEQAAEQRPSGSQQQAASGEGRQYGEGNYAATKQYNEGLKKHLETSDVEQEARDAAPRSQAEAQEMEKAERVGRSRAKGDVESPGKE
jgi:hypothetical protein